MSESKKVEDVKENDLQEFGLENLEITVAQRSKVEFDNYELEDKFNVGKGIRESELCLVDVSSKVKPEDDKLVRDIMERVRNNPDNVREQLISAPAKDQEAAVQELVRLENKQVDTDWVVELDSQDVKKDSDMLITDRFELKLQLENKRIVNALVDSGASTNFVASEIVADMPKQECGEYVVTGAFPGNKNFNEMVKLKFNFNGMVFEENFGVLKGFHKQLILGMPFIRKYHTQLDFGKKTLCGAAQFDEIPLMDADEFLLEARRGQVGMFFIKSQDDDASDDEVANKEDVMSMVKGGNKIYFAELINEYRDIFKLALDQTPPLRGAWDPNIEVVPHISPPVTSQYRLSMPEQEELHKQVKKMLETGLISPTPPQCTGYNSPVLFVRKSDQSFRLCVDFRLLNLVVIQKQFSMPVAEVLIREVAGYRFYTRLDMTSAFHQLRLDDQSKYYTTFTAFGKRYHFKVLPFGLSISPASLCEVMAEVLDGIEGCRSYVDDIIVFSNSLEEHERILRELFDRFRKYTFYFKPTKCSFGDTSTSFLGHEISADGVSIPEDHLRTIRELQCPETSKGMRKVMGFMNFFRGHVRNFAKLSGPLIEFMNAKKMLLTEVHIRCFEEMRQCLLNSPILKIIDYNCKPVEFQLEVDASHTAIGAVLFQVKPGDKLYGPIAMLSRRLTSAETRYPVRQQEFLAIVYAVTKLRHLILGYKVTVVTDHQSLTSVMMSSSRPENNRMIRWIEILMDYNIRIRYRSGEENTLADVLSRMVGHLNIDDLEITEEDLQGGDINLSILLGNEKLLNMIKDSYQTDDYLLNVIKYLRGEEDVPPEMKSAIKKYKMHDDLLLYKSFATFKPVVGAEAAKEIIRTFHRQGHVGITKLYWAIQPYVYVHKLLPMITEIVNACDTCQRTKSINRYMGGLMIPSEVPRDCFSHIHIDFITGLPVSTQGFDAIMVVVDALTKYTICCPCKKTYSAMDVAKLLMTDVFSVFGVPHKVISDKDIRFMNLVFDYIYEYYQIQMATTSTNNPAANGQVESINRSVVNVLRAYCGLESAHWSTYIKIVQFTLNTHWAKSIQMTPYQAVFGRLPRDQYGLSDFYMTHSNADAAALVTRAQLIRTYIKDNLSRYYDDMEANMNKGKKDTVYKLGDLVLLHRDAYYTPFRYRKLTPVYYGPFKIVKVINDKAYELDLPKISKKDRVINSKWFRPYIMDKVAFRDVPRPGKESELRAAEISAILGIDYENQTLDVTWLGCRPSHATTVLLDWFNQFVPKNLRRTLYENAKALFGDRAEPHQSKES